MKTVSFHRFIPDHGMTAMHNDKMIMSLGEPLVQRFFTMKELQNHICTLEQAIEDEPNFKQRLGLQMILDCFIVSLDMIKQNHEEFIKEAPTGADLEEYLFNYSKAISSGAL